MGLQVTDNYYEHIPEKIINVNSTTTIWDVPVVTDRTILANWPDLVLHDKKTEDLPTDRYSHTRNMNTKENKQLNKYKDLEIEVSRMWKLRTKIVSDIIGALGTIKKVLDQNVQLLPGHLSATELWTHLMHTAGVNCFNFLLRSNLPKDRHLITNGENKIIIIMHINRCCNFYRQKCDQARSREDSKIRRTSNWNSVHVECESKSDTSNNRGDWNHSKITQTVPEQHTRKTSN